MLEPLSYRGIADLALVKVNIALPGVENARKIAYYIENVLTKSECDRLIMETERLKYIPALLNTGYGQVLDTEVRNNTRCMLDSIPDSTEIYARIGHLLPPVMYKLAGLNERLRYLKYDPGERFNPHLDGCYKRNERECSYVTLQLYLNEGM